MQIDYSKRFLRSLKKSPKNIKNSFKLRLALFITNYEAQILNNHALKGRWLGYRSINITGDWRAIFTEVNNYDVVKFQSFGTHSQLYG